MMITNPINWLTLLLLFFLASCKEKKLVDISQQPDLFISINIGHHAFINVNQGIYIVRFIDHPNDTIKFTLTKKEKDSIKREYYDSRLDEIVVDSVSIQDYCRIMPKIYTMMHVETQSKRQIFYGDQNCYKKLSINYPNDNSVKIHPKRINHFMQLVTNIVRSKSEVKATRPSNYIYM